MTNNLYFQILGLFSILFLLVKYYSKKRKPTIESNTFLVLLFINSGYLILSFFASFIVHNYGAEFIFSIILSKLSLVVILMWLITLTMYIHFITLKKRERIDETNIFTIKKYFIKKMPLLFLGMLIIIILPIKIIDTNTIYSSGYAVYFMTAIGALIIFYWLYRAMSRHNHTKKEFTKLCLTFFLTGVLTILLQLFYPAYLMIDFIMYFSMFIIFLKIENSDLDILSELEAAKKRIEEVEAAKTNALLNISHEIRTSLTSIIGFSQSIIEESSDNVVSDVQYIKEAAEKLLYTADNILKVSNTSEVKVKLIESNYNFELLIKQIVAIAKSKLDESKVAFKFKMSNTIPPQLHGDNMSLKQAILNILDNSIKYTKEGHIFLDISNVIIGNTCRLIIDIKDTGLGISADELDKIEREKISKEILYINNPLKEENETSIIKTKKIIEAMGGQVLMESEYGEGTLVKISVDQKIINETVTENIILETNHDETLLKKILIVDDDKLNLKVAERLLKQYNYDIDTVTSGEQCLNRINNNKESYSIIFMDEMMPVMSGSDTLKLLKENKGFHTPVVALTANATSGVKEQYLEAGYSDYLAKPVERKELDRIIDRFLK